MTIPEFLSVETSAKRASCAEQLLFPHLVNLELPNITFCFDPGNSEEDEVLSVRAAAGAKVRQLRLRFPVNMFKRNVEKLKEVVGEVILDPQDVRYIVPDSRLGLDSKVVRDIPSWLRTMNTHSPYW